MQAPPDSDAARLNSREIAGNVWTVEGPEIVFLGASMHTRMTVVRLSGGELWVHSPIPLDETVQQFLGTLGGAVVALVAPNKFHHLFVSQWREAYPTARVFAEQTLKNRIAQLSDAECIGADAPDLYGDDIEQRVFGNRLFQEAVFFHKASRTLILTDLLINLKIDKMKFLPALYLRLEGVVFPKGGLPRMFRWLMRDRRENRAMLETVRAWSPQQITFCHGEPFTEEPMLLLERELGRLVV